MAACFAEFKLPFMLSQRRGSITNAPDDMTLFPVPEFDTATNKLLSYVIAVQELSAAEVRLVQVIPSGLVITLFPVPEEDTAANKPAPYVTLRQTVLVAEVRIVQVIPSGLVITLFPAPVLDTATNKLLP